MDTSLSSLSRVCQLLINVIPKKSFLDTKFISSPAPHYVKDSLSLWPRMRTIHAKRDLNELTFREQQLRPYKASNLHSWCRQRLVGLHPRRFAKERNVCHTHTRKMRYIQYFLTLVVMSQVLQACFITDCPIGLGKRSMGSKKYYGHKLSFKYKF